MKKVVKFGGSFLASAEQFKKVGEIIRADHCRRYVVPSAPGKRSSSDTKVTENLCFTAATILRSGKRNSQDCWTRSRQDIRRSLTDWNWIFLWIMNLKRSGKTLPEKSEEIMLLPAGIFEWYHYGQLPGILLY